MASRMEIDAGSDVCTDDEQTLLPQPGSTQRRLGAAIVVAITLFAGAALLIYSQKTGLQQVTGGGLSALTELSDVGDTCFQKAYEAIGPAFKKQVQQARIWKCSYSTVVCGNPQNPPKLANALNKCCAAECKAKIEGDKCLKDAWKTAGTCDKYVHMCGSMVAPGQVEAAKKVKTCCKDVCEEYKRQWKAADAPAVLEIFKRFDADGNGALKGEEYVKYLKGIHLWGIGYYTDKKWDQGWKAECSVLKCTDKGVTLKEFKEIQYGKTRLGMAKKDLYTCKTFSSENCASFKCPSKTFLRPQSQLLFCPASGCNKYSCCLQACEDDTDPKCSLWTKQKGECTKPKMPWPPMAVKVCPKSCGAKGCPIPPMTSFAPGFGCAPGYEEPDSESACKASLSDLEGYTYGKAAKEDPHGCVGSFTTKKVYFNGKTTLGKALPQGLMHVCHKKSAYYKEVARAQKAAFKASCASFKCHAPATLRPQGELLMCPSTGCAAAHCCLTATTTEKPCASCKTCADFKCPAPKTSRPQAGHLPCFAGGCKSMQCCLEPTCASFTCPAPMTLRLQPGRLMCASGGCTAAHCCLMPTTTPKATATPKANK